MKSDFSSTTAQWVKSDIKDAKIVLIQEHFEIIITKRIADGCWWLSLSKLILVINIQNLQKILSSVTAHYSFF